VYNSCSPICEKTVTGLCSGNANTAEDVICDGGLQNKGSRSSGTTPVDCCEAACDWSIASVTQNNRCLNVLWDFRVQREEAQTKCQEDSSCLGLMWFNKDGGDGLTATQGWYQGCGGTAGTITNDDWDTILVPPACQADYALGEGGMNGCPSGYRNILTVSACQSAAQARGYTYSSFNSSSEDMRPRGCFLWTDRAYFNTNTGYPTNPAGSCSPICEKGATTTTTNTAEYPADEEAATAADEMAPQADYSYNKLPQSGYCRTSTNAWHCWLNVALTPLTQEGCSAACTGLSTCTAYTYDSQQKHGTGCYLYPTNCVGSSGMTVSSGGRGPWSLEGSEVCARGSDSPTSAQTYLKQAAGGRRLEDFAKVDSGLSNNFTVFV